MHISVPLSDPCPIACRAGSRGHYRCRSVRLLSRFCFWPLLTIDPSDLYCVYQGSNAPLSRPFQLPTTNLSAVQYHPS